MLANYDLESRVVMEPSVNAFSSDSWIQEKGVGPFDTVHATVMLLCTQTAETNRGAHAGDADHVLQFTVNKAIQNCASLHH